MLMPGSYCPRAEELPQNRQTPRNEPQLLASQAPRNCYTSVRSGRVHEVAGEWATP